ncbi:CidA/LrgA family protein [Nitratidesulfovibrio sp. SRB-5]|uniref:CidA/LrgA family protein n=1 Tax=Nitratidesulfovibrio sp. SRB-5 TaxID=2872636 RepID=UPI001024CBCF|nr:CidA/LrgA family protein [Nitratidesulfovibrio sp. SRB-5]MBZ2172134.1 CidA/LrgA family protein [Nitratidesulfovibrio sp. SRB-5]RXF76407.1 CidA/LrgA family protein [Desulfovibrio sp. DS-1]
MSVRKISLSLRLAARRSRLIQSLFLAALWLAGEAVARYAHLPVPGGVVGLLLVLLLLSTGTVNAVDLQRGARWLMAEMLLFFVPAVLAVLDHREFLSLLGLKLLAVVLLGTLTVMGGTALVVDVCCRMHFRGPAHALAGPGNSDPSHAGMTPSGSPRHPS